MIIRLSDIKKKIYKRIPELDPIDISTYIDALINIMRERITASIPVVIGNFGTISRKISHERRAYNVSKMEWNIIKPTYIVLIPNLAFLKYLKYPENRKYLKLKIIEKSKRLFLDNQKTSKHKLKV